MDDATIRRSVKRVFDIVVAAVLLLLMLPMLLVVALVIKLDSPGPALIRQTRVGRHGRLFEMLKFRTMIPNAAFGMMVRHQAQPERRMTHKSAGRPADHTCRPLPPPQLP